MSDDEFPREVTEKVSVPPPAGLRALPPALPRPTGLEKLWELHVQAIDDRLRAFHGELSLLRAATLAALPDEPEPKSSAQKVKSAVVSGAGKGLRWSAYISLALAVAAQLASILKPGLVGPLQAIGKMLEGAAGAQ